MTLKLNVTAPKQERELNEERDRETNRKGSVGGQMKPVPESGDKKDHPEKSMKGREKLNEDLKFLRFPISESGRPPNGAKGRPGHAQPVIKHRLIAELPGPIHSNCSAATSHGEKTKAKEIPQPQAARSKPTRTVSRAPLESFATSFISAGALPCVCSPRQMA